MSALDKPWHRGLSYREWVAVPKMALVICEVNGCVKRFGNVPEPCDEHLKAAEECLRSVLLKPCPHERTVPYAIHGTEFRRCLDCDKFALDYYIGRAK